MSFGVPIKIALLVLGCLSGCLVGSVGFAAPPTIIEDLMGLSASEIAHDQALMRLRSVKRDELIANVRALLRQHSSEVFAVRAISDLELAELKPEFDQLVRTTTSFDVVQAADVPANVLHEKLRDLLGQKKNSGLKSTILAKLKDPLTDGEFAKLVDDPDYIVRESVVSQFFVSMSQLPAEEQTNRFKQLIGLKPVQARTSAMNLYRQLDPSTKMKLKPAWKSANCKSENVEETKTLCLLLQKESLK